MKDKKKQTTKVSNTDPTLLNGPAKDSKKAVTNKFHFEDIGFAVRDMADISERIMTQVLVLGDLAQAIHNKHERLETDHLEWGLPIRALTPELKSLFRTWRFEEQPYGYEYTVSPPTKWHIKIPVRVIVYKTNYKFFQNPDRGWYGVDDFNIPNPFDKYWKARFIIR